MSSYWKTGFDASSNRRSFMKMFLKFGPKWTILNRDFGRFSKAKCFAKVAIFPIKDCPFLDNYFVFLT